MINEVLEVQEYLCNKNIEKKSMYRICYLLAKWFKQQNLSHIEIRQAIFAWANKYNINIEQNLNGIIYQVLEDKKPLRDNVPVKINPLEIEEIKHRFDTKNTRLVSLALLCCSKAFGDKDGVISVGMNDLSHWTGIAPSSLSGRVMNELIDFQYVEKMEAEQQFTWNEKVKSKKNRFRLLIPYETSGTFLLQNNDLSKLYQDIF